MILALMLAQAVPVAPPPPPIVVAGSPLYPIGQVDVATKSGVVTLQLSADEDTLVLTAFSRNYILGSFAIDSPGSALTILTNRQLEPLWKPLLDHAGADLTKLRDKMVAKAESGWRRGLAQRPSRTAVESLSQDESVRALLIYAEALNAAGQGDRAAELLQLWVTEQAASSDPYDVTMVAIRLAAIHWHLRDTKRAFDALLAGRAYVANDKEYRANIDVNHAAYLAEAGHHADALRLHDQAIDGLDKSDLKLARSLRQFAWIRACALNGLGRVKEAGEAMAAARQGNDALLHRGAILPPGAEVRLRGYRCLRDKEGLVREIVATGQQDYPMDGWLTLLQQARQRREPQALWQAVLSDPRVTAAYGARLRQLPPELIPALNSWRVDADAAAR